MVCAKRCTQPGPPPEVGKPANLPRARAHNHRGKSGASCRLRAQTAGTTKRRRRVTRKCLVTGGIRKVTCSRRLFFFLQGDVACCQPCGECWCKSKVSEKPSVWAPPSALLAPAPGPRLLENRFPIPVLPATIRRGRSVAVKKRHNCPVLRPAHGLRLASACSPGP